MCLSRSRRARVGLSCGLRAVYHERKYHAYNYRFKYMCLYHFFKGVSLKGLDPKPSAPCASGCSKGASAVPVPEDHKLPETKAADRLRP